jgi:hypothetical protein
MLTCRSISPRAWEQARNALTFYFSRRHGIDNAEDLAHDTLAAILSRDDFEFEKEEDFLRVCYAFAARVSQSGYRKARKHAASTLDPAVHEPSQRTGGPGLKGMNSTEIKLLLDEVMHIAGTNLREKDWEAICLGVRADGLAADSENSSESGNTFRVRLFRARKKLVQLTGWKKSAT